MKIGMLWLDDSKRPLKAKVASAADYYSEKYGATPTLCFVHPSELDGCEGGSNGVELRAARFVTPGYLWLGIEMADSAKSNGKRQQR
jgi:hypothetical protein